ncbi:hypothetical protein Sste5346_005256 [Sporothrix stenoceras]|uniref:F-box domain containing protein n=1 Tax=Sporothrix stenoceras TaxID=5173 RepID=A0ABR3Z494_9PEZI
MSSERLLQTDNDEELQRELLLQLTSTSSLPSTLSSALSSTSTIKESHEALFRVFSIWPIYQNIFSNVAPAHQAALALTCRRLRKSLAGVADVRTLRKCLPRPYFLDVLWAIAYDLPDHYVCEQCMYLHRSARSVRSEQKKTTKSTTTTSTNTAAGHAYDVSLVQEASEDFLVGKFAPVPIPELEPPFLALFSAQLRRWLSSFTFMSRLSSTRRTPLAGLAHRDVQLLLKRVRSLRERREDKEIEPVQSKDIEQELFEHGSSPAPSPVWRSWCSRFSTPLRMLGNTKKQDGNHDGTDMDMEMAVRYALQPFLAERQAPVPELIGTAPYTLKYKFVPRVVLCNRDNPDKDGGPEQRARFLLQTVVSIRMYASWEMPLCICPHQLFNKKGCPAWRQARFDALLALRDQDICRGPGNEIYVSGSGLTPTPEGVQHAQPASFRLQNAIDCVRDDRVSRQDCVADPIHHPHCHDPSLRYSEYDEDMSPYEQTQLAAMKACGMARAQVDGYVLSASCDRCPTDFVVQTANDPVGRPLKDELVITVWQDFGSEAPVTDELWQSHIPGLFLQAELDNAQAPYTQANTWQSGPTVSHSPGSVRALFETGEPAYAFQGRGD